MSKISHLVKETAKGIVIGVANIIPGVSGGTMAVSMGVYDKLISAVTELKKNFKQSIIFLLPYLIGAVAGIALLSFVVRYTLTTWPLQTAGLFIGLILGGLPVILQNFRGQKISIHHGIAFLLFFALVIVMSLGQGNESTATDFILSPGIMIQLFFVGIIAAATMIIPGVSGSMVLMILGFYNGIISNISSFIEAIVSFDTGAIAHGFGVFVPFGIGILIGIAVIAKIIKWLFEHAPVLTYSAILGLIIASPIAIFLETGIQDTDFLQITVSIITLAIGFGIAFFLAREKKETV
ncbi:MAG: putative rane protein [Clostridiales bacterium]|jgi:putative membrane protein|nr:putative rane protein [Clostridiales bacterium]